MDNSATSTVPGCASTPSGQRAPRHRPFTTTGIPPCRRPRNRCSTPSAGRPGHDPAPHDVAVHMEDALPRVRALIEDEPVAAARKPQLLGDIARSEQDLAEE